ncbi:hypothetical protein WJX84_003672, partial [Apatococcus fuscideae]
MEFYPAELATPPLALVALLGLPDLHSKIGNYLRSNHRPPINSISVPEPSGAGRIFGERKPLLTSGVSALGILKADWFVKHRQRRPGVAAVLFERSAVVGDPAGWQRVCSQLEGVRAATRVANARIVVVMVQDVAAGEVPEDRA